MVLLIGHVFYQSDASYETTVYNGSCHSENVGERCGICDFSVKHLSSTVFPSLFDNHGFTAGRQRSLSVLMKAYLPDTECTQPTHATDSPKTYAKYIESWLKL